MKHKLTFSGWGPHKGFPISWCERCGAYGKALKEPCRPVGQPVKEKEYND